MLVAAVGHGQSAARIKDGLVELGVITWVRHHYMDGMSFDQIGALLGVTKGRISQLHRAAINLLRSRMINRDDFKLER